MNSPTPESQQAALKLFVVAANLRMNTRDGFTQKLCSGHRLANSEDEARGIYTKHLQETFSDWMISDLLVMEVLPEHLPSATPVSESHAALAEEVADAIYSGGGYGNSGQKAWRLNKTEDEMTDCLHIAQRAMQAALRAHPVGGVSELDALAAALVSLTADAIKPDIQELLVHGDASRGVRPGVLMRAMRAAGIKTMFYGIDLASKPDTLSVRLPNGEVLLDDEARAALRAAGIGAGVVSDRAVESACYSFRHDFGLLSDEEQRLVRHEARKWLYAWQKELSPHTGKSE